MPTISYPSETAPGLPTVSLDAPAGWEPLVAADVLLAAGAPAGGRGFRSNVTISTQRLPEGVALADVEERLLDELRATYPDLEEAERFAGDIGGHDARVAEYAFTEPAAGTLFQVQLLVLTRPRGGLRDLLQAHATCAAARAVDEIAGFRSMFRSLRIG
jgi:hypothetical protein